MFVKGELVTAINTGYYLITANGWTGKVISGSKDGDFEVEAADLNEYFYEKSWTVKEKFFIPYSSNLERENFNHFHFARDRYKRW